MARPIYGCLLFLSVARGTFFSEAGQKQKKEKGLQCELICDGRAAHKLFSVPGLKRTTSEERIYIKLHERKESFVLVALKLRTNKQRCTRVQA